jgi:hypothetical protein
MFLSRRLTFTSVRLSYNPCNDKSPTGFSRPPPIPACVLDYFKAISVADEKFQVAEMRALMQDPDFYPRVKVTEAI